MSQTSYAYEMAVAFPGMKADISNSRCVSKECFGDIGFGLGVVQHSEDEQCRLPSANQAVITDDAGTYTAGDIVATLTLSQDGKDDVSVVVTESFDTDKDTTLAALAASIAASAYITSAVYAAGSHTITIIATDYEIAVAVDVTGITGTMTISSTVYTSADTAAMLVGITVHDTAREQSAAGVVQLSDTEAASVGSKIAVYVQADETVALSDSVYLRTMDDGTKLRGMFGKTSDAGKTVQITNAKWRQAGSTTVPPVLEINLP